MHEYFKLAAANLKTVIRVVVAKNMKILITVVVLAIAAVAHAERSERSTDDLCRTSKVIVVGTLTNLQEIATKEAVIVSAQLVVKEVLKGPSTNVVSVLWGKRPLEEDSMDFSSKAGGTDVWFLLWPSDKGYWLTFSDEFCSTNRIAQIRTMITSHNQASEATARKLAEPQR